MRVTIRRFEASDIENKVKWINDPENNEFLHYDLPLTVEKTRKWYEGIKNRTDRYDAIIEADGIPCGTIGLLSIDRKNLKAEFYIAMGDVSLKGKGVASDACRILLEFAFSKLGLNRVYLFTEEKNIIGQKLFKKVGFTKEGFIRDDLFCRGKFVNRYLYGITKDEFEKIRNSDR